MGGNFFFWSNQPILTTGVAGVGEFIKMSEGTWEAHNSLHGQEYLAYKCKTQEARKAIKGG